MNVSTIVRRITELLKIHGNITTCWDVKRQNGAKSVNNQAEKIVVETEVKRYVRIYRENK